MENVMRDITLTGFETWGLLLASLIVVVAAARKRHREIRAQGERDSLPQ
jgi:hypothetical protein